MEVHPYLQVVWGLTADAKRAWWSTQRRFIGIGWEQGSRHIFSREMIGGSEMGRSWPMIDVQEWGRGQFSARGR